MNAFSALTLYPLWAVATAVGMTALRLGRARGQGLLLLCLSHALWTSSLILLQIPTFSALAERILPTGMIVAAAFVHAGADVAELSKRGFVWATYIGSTLIGVFGVANPYLLYAPGVRAPGPLFLPMAVLCALGTIVMLAWLLRLAYFAEGPRRRRLLVLVIAGTMGSLGGGGILGVRILGWGDVHHAAPLLLIAIVLAAHGVLSSEKGRSRELVVQGLAYAAITAAFSSLGLTAFFKLIPYLSPGAGHSLFWVIFVVFFATLPADPLRMLVVEMLGRRLFRRPIGVRDLAEQVVQQEVRADQAERLAEIGKMASAVAHEIRNPLGVIAAQAKLMERAGASPASVQAIRAQIDRTKRFLDDLLRYSKPRPLDTREIDASATLQMAVSHVRQAMGETCAPITLEKGGSSPLLLEADQGAFLDVAIVLLQNAAIAVDGVERGHVWVRISEYSDQGIEVVVEDNGKGVPETIEGALFQPFVTGRSRDSRHPGTGLGLAIAARWVERHGGQLRYERRNEGGARFLARWPKHTSAGAPTAGFKTAALSHEPME